MVGLSKCPIQTLRYKLVCQSLSIWISRSASRASPTQITLRHSRDGIGGPRYMLLFRSISSADRRRLVVVVEERVELTDGAAAARDREGAVEGVRHEHIIERGRALVA